MIGSSRLALYSTTGKRGTEPDFQAHRRAYRTGGLQIRLRPSFPLVEDIFQPPKKSRVTSWAGSAAGGVAGVIEILVTGAAAAGLARLRHHRNPLRRCRSHRIPSRHLRASAAMQPACFHRLRSGDETLRCAPWDNPA